ncbi:deferrochelatase/peroxidase EfeB, partial [Cellulomonas hominis]
MRTTPDDTVTPDPTSTPDPVPARSSRRALLRGGGAGLLATAVALGAARGA